MIADQLRYVAITDDTLRALTELLTGERWDYFGRPVLTPADVRASWDDGDYSGPESEGFLIENLDGAVVGMLRLFDLQDPTALFDIRLRAGERGKGYGSAAVRWVVRRAFGKPDIARLEANTRADNSAMRITLKRCGFVKEGHHRAADDSGHDWVTYCLLRRDWESGTSTPLRWDDEPTLDR